MCVCVIFTYPTSYQYMIDNVILIITGTLHERDTHELLERCHPLGVFDTMPALCVATTVAELYNTVLVETPLGKCNKKIQTNAFKSDTHTYTDSSLLCKLSQRS